MRDMKIQRIGFNRKGVSIKKSLPRIDKKGLVAYKSSKKREEDIKNWEEWKDTTFSMI